MRFILDCGIVLAPVDANWNLPFIQTSGRWFRGPEYFGDFP